MGIKIARFMLPVFAGQIMPFFALGLFALIGLNPASMYRITFLFALACSVYMLFALSVRGAAADLTFTVPNVLKAVFFAVSFMLLVSAPNMPLKYSGLMACMYLAGSCLVERDFVRSCEKAYVPPYTKSGVSYYLWRLAKVRPLSVLWYELDELRRFFFLLSLDSSLDVKRQATRYASRSENGLAVYLKIEHLQNAVMADVRANNGLFNLKQKLDDLADCQYEEIIEIVRWLRNSIGYYESEES